MRTHLARFGLATALMVPSAQPQAVSGQTADMAPRSAIEVEDLRLRRFETSAQNAPDSVVPPSDLRASGENRVERDSSEYEEFVTRSVFRKKPVLPAATEEMEAPVEADR